MDDDFATELGITATDAGGEMRSMYYRCICQQEPDATQRSIVQWSEAAEGLFEVCLQRIEVSWRDLAGRFAKRFGADFDSLPTVVQRVWEAVVRHGVNLVMAEDDEDLATAREYDWREWILQKVKQGVSDEALQDAND